MACSLELRSPFLDHEVLELGLGLPDSLKVRGARGKVALRRAFAADLPPEILELRQARLRRPRGAVVPDRAAGARRRPPARRARLGTRPLPPRRGRDPARGSRRRARRPRRAALEPRHARALAAGARGRTPPSRPPHSRPLGEPPQRLRGRRGRLRRCRASCVLLYERGDVLSEFTEKSDDFARTFVESGTYGFIPGEPSAYTQPLYGFLLMPLYALYGRALARRRARADRARRSRRRCSSTRSGGAGSRRAVCGRGRSRRHAAPVPRLARRAREPRDPRHRCSRPRSCC